MQNHTLGGKTKLLVSCFGGWIIRIWVGYLWNLGGNLASQSGRGWGSGPLDLLASYDPWLSPILPPVAATRGWGAARDVTTYTDYDRHNWRRAERHKFCTISTSNAVVASASRLAEAT